MRHLVLMRHGHARDIDIHDNGLNADFHRELRDKGKRNAQRQGVWLLRNNLLPDRVIASPARRARRTAEKCVKTAGLGAGMIIFRDDLYPGKWQHLLSEIRKSPDDCQTLLVVGHNPGMDQLLEQLSKDPLPFTPKNITLTPAALAVLEIDGSWQDVEPGQARLQDLVIPKKLPREFPWPDIHGDEGRSRPSYYYQQSSVVPWRLENGELQVLVIASSKQRHLVIPKGIHDPGKTAQESAANEAYEEAGVNGTVSQNPIGHYRYDKWDAECVVTVYAMQVSDILDEADWPEQHRGRQWLSVEAAANAVQNPEVGRMIRALPGFLKQEQQI